MTLKELDTYLEQLSKDGIAAHAKSRKCCKLVGASTRVQALRDTVTLPSEPHRHLKLGESLNTRITAGTQVSSSYSAFLTWNIDVVADVHLPLGNYESVADYS